MTQDESPAPASTVEENPAPESVPAPPALPVAPEPNPKVDAPAPDPYAVGVRVLRLAPAWLLAVTVGCSALVLLLGWVNGDGAATAVARSPAPNDARASRPAPAAPPALSVPTETARPAAPAAGRPAAPAPTQAAPEPAVEKAAEKTQPEPPAGGDEAAAKFTVQVGSFDSQSEANERVSGLRREGFEARAVAVEIDGRGTWHRVQVGRFADREGAAKTQASLRAKGAAAAALVVPLQK